MLQAQVLEGIPSLINDHRILGVAYPNLESSVPFSQEVLQQPLFEHIQKQEHTKGVHSVFKCFNLLENCSFFLIEVYLTYDIL